MYRIQYLLIMAILNTLLLHGQQNSSDTLLSLFNHVNQAIATAWGPPDATSKLHVLCHVGMGEKYLNYIDTGNGTICVVSFTTRKMKNPQKEMSLKMNMMVNPIRFTYPGTQDWAYVFDRNGDRKVDYIAYLMGPMPKKEWDKERPKGFYREKQKFDTASFHYIIDHFEGIFYHWIDSDYDGKTDWLIYYETDPNEGNLLSWVDHWLLIHRPAEGQPIKAPRWFRDSQKGFIGHSPKNESGIYYRYDAKEIKNISISDFVWPDEMLRQVNDGIGDCRYPVSGIPE